jgi:hypothetical protein
MKAPELLTTSRFGRERVCRHPVWDRLDSAADSALMRTKSAATLRIVKTVVTGRFGYTWGATLRLTTGF